MIFFPGRHGGDVVDGCFYQAPLDSLVAAGPSPAFRPLRIQLIPALGIAMKIASKLASTLQDKNTTKT
jgi:hypothetical protein